MERLVDDGDENKVLVEEVHVLGPATDAQVGRVPFGVGALIAHRIRIEQPLVEEKVEEVALGERLGRHGLLQGLEVKVDQ